MDECAILDRFGKTENGDRPLMTGEAIMRVTARTLQAASKPQMIATLVPPINMVSASVVAQRQLFTKSVQP